MPCTQCKESFQDSYNVTVDTLKCESPTLSAHDMRIQAAQRFRPVYHAMKEASRIENEGNEKYENGEFELTQGGEMYFLNTGVTAEQLHKNQRRSSELKNNPDEYSVNDHQISTLVQHALANGATVVRTSFSRDGRDNRDIVEYVYDRATNRGIIRVINTAQNGLYHNFDTIREIARRQSPHLTEVSPSEEIFVLTDAKVLPDKAQSVIQSIRHPDQYASDSQISSITDQTVTKSPDNHSDRRVSIEEPLRLKRSGSIQQIAETMTHASRRIVRETGETITGVSRFLQRKDIRQNTRDRFSGLPVLPDARLVFEKDRAGMSLSEGQSDRLTLKKIQERAVPIDESIVKRHREMRRGTIGFGIITDTGVSVHAVPLFLALVAEKLSVPVRAMEKSIKRHKKKEIRWKNHELRKNIPDARSDAEKGQPFKVERKRRKKRGKVYMEIPTGIRIYTFRERSRRKDKKRQKPCLENGIKKVATGSKLIPSASEKQEKRRKRRIRRVAKRVESTAESKQFLKREKKLLRLVKRFARRVEQKRKEMNIVPHKVTKLDSEKWTKPREGARRETVPETSRKESKEAVSNFSFAFIVWLLIRSKETWVQNHTMGQQLETLNDENSLVLHEIHQTQKQEGLIVKEPAQWILLSIIWYLAMVREAGLVKQARQATQAKQVRRVRKVRRVRQAVKKKKKMKQLYQKYAYFPKHAVIFAFNS